MALFVQRLKRHFKGSLVALLVRLNEALAIDSNVDLGVRLALPITGEKFCFQEIVRHAEKKYLSIG